MSADSTLETLDIGAIAAELLSLLGTGQQVAPLSERFAGFDLPLGYSVGHAVQQLRQQRGERPVGRKIGFTNRLMWDRYGVRAPVWAPVYATTVADLADLKGTVPLAGLPEPKIEPEIVFGLARAPGPGLDEAALLRCIDWVALGFELVQSIYPGWRFAAADTAAGFGLHAGLYIGARHSVGAAAESWESDLSSFEVDLALNGVSTAHGEAGFVLGGPLSALRHLNDLLWSGPAPLRLAAGEIITTGTITLAASVAAGEHWTATPRGIGLEPIALAFR